MFCSFRHHNCIWCVLFSLVTDYCCLHLMSSDNQKSVPLLLWYYGSQRRLFEENWDRVSLPIRHKHPSLGRTETKVYKNSQKWCKCTSILPKGTDDGRHKLLGYLSNTRSFMCFNTEIWKSTATLVKCIAVTPSYTVHPIQCWNSREIECSNVQPSRWGGYSHGWINREN